MTRLHLHKCFRDFYLSVKIIVSITGVLLAVCLAPLPDLGKGFALGALVFTFLWLFVYLYSRERKLGKCREDPIPNCWDVELKPSSENLIDVNAFKGKLQVLVGYGYLNSDLECNTRTRLCKRLDLGRRNLGF